MGDAIRWFVEPVPLKTIKTVEEAALLLDKIVPGWNRHINEASFDIKSFKDCILGQVFGSGLEGRVAFAKLKWHIGTVFSDYSFQQLWMDQLMIRDMSN